MASKVRRRFPGLSEVFLLLPERWEGNADGGNGDGCCEQAPSTYGYLLRQTLPLLFF